MSHEVASCHISVNQSPSLIITTFLRLSLSLRRCCILTCPVPCQYGRRRTRRRHGGRGRFCRLTLALSRRKPGRNSRSLVKAGHASPPEIPGSATGCSKFSRFLCYLLQPPVGPSCLEVHCQLASLQCAFAFTLGVKGLVKVV